jgi:hypothetical protein
MTILLGAIPYVLAILTIVLGFLQIAKEWGEYQKPRLRITVLSVLVAVAILTVVSLWLDSQQRQQEKKKSEGDIQDLKGQVQAASRSQSDNTILFLNSLSTMSSEVSQLKVEVKTEALQKRLAGVQADLEKTQKALAPGPKAEVILTFAPFDNPALGTGLKARPIVEKTMPLSLDGIFHLDVTVLNLTEVEATNVDLTLQICDGCRYAKEPPGFSKPSGVPDTARELFVPRISSLGFLPTFSLDVIPAAYMSAFTVGINYRCTTCTLPKEASFITVHISGRGEMIKLFKH